MKLGLKIRVEGGRVECLISASNTMASITISKTT